MYPNNLHNIYFLPTLISYSHFFQLKRVFKLALLLQIKVYFEKVKGPFYLESETHSIINMIIISSYKWRLLQTKFYRQHGLFGYFTIFGFYSSRKNRQLVHIIFLTFVDNSNTMLWNNVQLRNILLQILDVVKDHLPELFRFMSIAQSSKSPQQSCLMIWWHLAEIFYTAIMLEPLDPLIFIDVLGKI